MNQTMNAQDYKQVSEIVDNFSQQMRVRPICTDNKGRMLYDAIDTGHIYVSIDGWLHKMENKGRVGLPISDKVRVVIYPSGKKVVQ